MLHFASGTPSQCSQVAERQTSYALYPEDFKTWQHWFFFLHFPSPQFPLIYSRLTHVENESRTLIQCENAPLTPQFHGPRKEVSVWPSSGMIGPPVGAPTSTQTNRQTSNFIYVAGRFSFSDKTFTHVLRESPSVRYLGGLVAPFCADQLQSDALGSCFLHRPMSAHFDSFILKWLTPITPLQLAHSGVKLFAHDTFNIRH